MKKIDQLAFQKLGIMIKSTNPILETAPLVMVVGGYSPNRSMYNPKTRKYGAQIKGLINDVELIGISSTDIKCLGKEYEALSKKQKKKCRHPCSAIVNPVLGRYKRFHAEEGENEWENEGEMYGHVGAFSKDAAIVCGGKSGYDETNADLKKCWEWDSEINRYVFHYPFYYCLSVIF